MKRILMLTLVLLCLFIESALAASSASISVGGVQLVANDSTLASYAVNDQNGTVTTNSATAENYTIKLELVNGVPTLTLNDAIITNNSGNGIEAASDIVIYGNGTNVISGNVNAIKATGNITLSGTFGDISGGSNGGIYSTSGNIIIAQDAIIGDITSNWYTIQTDNGNIEINGTVGNVSGRIAITSEYSHDTTINGEIGNITGTDYGIFAYKDLIITNDAKVGDVSSGSGGLMAINTISIEGTCGSISGGTHGIYAMNSVDVSGSINDIEGQCAIRAISGDVNITGNIGKTSGNGGSSGAANSYGIRADDGKVVINSKIGPVSASSSGNNVSIVAIMGKTGIEIADDLIVTTPVINRIDMYNNTYYTIFDSANHIIADLVMFSNVNPTLLQNNVNVSLPQTGDSANPLLWILALAASAIGIAVCSRKVKKSF